VKRRRDSEAKGWLGMIVENGCRDDQTIPQFPTFTHVSRVLYSACIRFEPIHSRGQSMSLRINIHINIDESEPLAAKQYGKACHRHACDENTTRVKEPKEGEKKK
jgi:hypothetical protein